MLTGTLRAHGDRYRLNLQLVRVGDGAVVWGRPYDIASQDLASLQDDSVAEHVARALSLTLTAAERERVHRRYTQNGAAYTDFLQGRALLVEYTERRMLEAIGKFEAALARDPSYALARASLAMAFASYSVRYVGRRRCGPMGRACGGAGDARAPPGPEPGRRAPGARERRRHGVSELRLATRARRDCRGAVSRPEPAPRAHGPCPGALPLRAVPAARQPRPKRPPRWPASRASRTIACVSTPRSTAVASARRLGWARLCTSEPMPSRFLLIWRWRPITPATRLARSQALRAARRRGVPDLRAQAALASLEAAAGRHDAARTIVSRILAQTYRDHHIAYSLATTHAQLGQMDDAARWLTEAANTGFPCYPWFVRDPLLEPLRHSPQFRQVEPELRRTFEALSMRYGTSGPS